MEIAISPHTNGERNELPKCCSPLILLFWGGCCCQVVGYTHNENRSRAAMSRVARDSLLVTEGLISKKNCVGNRNFLNKDL